MTTAKILIAFCLSLAITAAAQNLAVGQHIERNATIFIEPMDGFEGYLTAAILSKKVPVVITDDKSKAEYVITGQSHLEKAGWAKTIFVTPAPSAGATIEVKNQQTGNLVFAYTVDKFAARRANQTTAESCAKHLREAIEK